MRSAKEHMPLPGMDMGNAFTTVQAVSPLSGWIGGKSRLAPLIIPLMPRHTCYCEPFCGAAWVLFRKSPSQCEVINDINGEIVNLFRQCRDNMDGLVDFFRWSLISREEFNYQKSLKADELDPLKRACRFLYLQKVCFGGLYTDDGRPGGLTF